jgi:hypothetical protein
MFTRPGNANYTPPPSTTGTGTTPGIDPNITSIAQLQAVSTVILATPAIKIWVETATGLTHVSKLMADGNGNVVPNDYTAAAPKSWYDSGQ